LSGKFVFSDNLGYESKKWKYCTMKDRRFHSEYKEENGAIGAAGTLQLSNDKKAFRLPIDCFDTGFVLVPLPERHSFPPLCSNQFGPTVNLVPVYDPTALP
jgi:hypothetical protein